MAAKLVYLEDGVLLATEAGARAFIRKPFSVQDLSERIEPPLAKTLEMAKMYRASQGYPGGYPKRCWAGYFFERVPLTSG